MADNVFFLEIIIKLQVGWVIDIEVIGLMQDKISFSGPLLVCNVILRDNYFMRFVGVPAHGDFHIPNLFRSDYMAGSRSVFLKN